MKEFKILSPTAILGYGFPESSFLRGIAEKPDLIAVDGGSVDPGPYYLGSGKAFTNRVGVKRDLRYMLKAGVELGVPVVVGTAGGSGAKAHLDWCRDIVLEIAAEEKLDFKLGLIYADVAPELIKQAIRDKKTEALADLAPLSETDVDQAAAVVAQMGTERIIAALDAGCRVILAGRAYDPSCFSSLPIKLGYDPALATHLGKILECAAIAADPGSGADSVLGILKDDAFILKPLSDARRFTSTSVAAHSLYEKSDPYSLPGPGGSIDLRQVSFTEIGGGMVEVKGTRFVPTEGYKIKLEGVRSVGFRTVSMAGTRDPIMIGQIEEILKKVQESVDANLANEGLTGKISFHLYGKNAVMGALEPDAPAAPQELGILMEAVAPTQSEADTICSIVRSSLLHYGYPGRIATAGNLAFPFSPSDIQAGEVFEFHIYHLMEVEDESLFPLETMDVKGASA